jgi:hypothetical protein
MLKAVKNYHYSTEQKTLQHPGRRNLEEYVFEVYLSSGYYMYHFLYFCKNSALFISVCVCLCVFLEFFYQVSIAPVRTLTYLCVMYTHWFLIHVPCIFYYYYYYYYYYNQQTHKYHYSIYHNSVSLHSPRSYMFRHFHVTIRKFRVCALLSYINC